MSKNAEHKKWIFICILAAAVLAAGALWRGFAGKNDEKLSFEVTVRAAEYTGQGVAYRQQGDKLYIVTAGHVLDALSGTADCEVVFANQEQRTARVIYRSETADLAFLEVPVGDDERGAQTVPASRERFDALADGDRLWAASVLDGEIQKTEGELLYFWVYLEDFSLNMMLARMDCRAGMSGCAILEEDGYFAGILCGVSESGEAAILPYSIIESEWSLMVERGILK